LKIDQTGRRAQATRPTFLNHFPKENTAILNSPFSILHSFHGAINQNLQFWLPGRFFLLYSGELTGNRKKLEKTSGFPMLRPGFSLTNSHKSFII